jgi:dynamin 1-like protein
LSQDDRPSYSFLTFQKRKPNTANSFTGKVTNHSNPIGPLWTKILGQVFSDYNEVRKEMENEMARVAGINKGISDQPIILRIFSPDVINLSLIDLPGLTKVPIGEQPIDIEDKIRSIVKYYIQNPNTIILCVLPANVDLANSDA